MTLQLDTKRLKKEVPETLTSEDCLVDNRSESGIERAFGLSKRSSKNCQSFNGSSSSSLTEDQCFGKRSSEPMVFANFLGL